MVIIKSQVTALGIFVDRTQAQVSPPVSVPPSPSVAGVCGHTQLFLRILRFRLRPSCEFSQQYSYLLSHCAIPISESPISEETMGCTVGLGPQLSI